MSHIIQNPNFEFKNSSQCSKRRDTLKVIQGNLINHRWWFELWIANCKFKRGSQLTAFELIVINLWTTMNWCSSTVVIKKFGVFKFRCQFGLNGGSLNLDPKFIENFNLKLLVFWPNSWFRNPETFHQKVIKLSKNCGHKFLGLVTRSN